MRLLCLCDELGNRAWIFEKNGEPDWLLDEDDVILTLAKPHDAVEVKILDRETLGTVDEYASFDLLWEDRGTPQEFNDAFNACFALPIA